METTTVEITLKEGSPQAEGLLTGSVLNNLLRFEGAVGVVAGEPVLKAFGKRIMIEWMLQISHWPVNNRDAVHQSLKMHKLRTEETDILRRRLYISKMAALKKVAATDTICNTIKILRNRIAPSTASGDKRSSASITNNQSYLKEI